MILDPPDESAVRAACWIFIILAVALSAGRSVFFAIRHGRRPIAAPRDAVEALWGRVFVIVSFSAFGVCVARLVSLLYYKYTIPFLEFETRLSLILAFISIIFGFSFALFAQSQMGSSWRIGVPDEPTKLVTRGIYKYLRNPIYSGFLLAEAGLLLLLPSAATAVILLLSTLTIRRWVKIEEIQQFALHGEAYLNYQKTSGRFFPKF